MSVCLYVCMYVCLYVCMYACMHVCMYVFIYSLNYLFIYSFIYLFIQITWNAIASCQSLHLYGSRVAKQRGSPNLWWDFANHHFHCHTGSNQALKKQKPATEFGFTDQRLIICRPGFNIPTSQLQPGFTSFFTHQVSPTLLQPQGFPSCVGAQLGWWTTTAPDLQMNRNFSGQNLQCPFFVSRQPQGINHRTTVYQGGTLYDNVIHKWYPPNFQQPRGFNPRLTWMVSW